MADDGFDVAVEEVFLPDYFDAPSKLAAGVDEELLVGLMKSFQENVGVRQIKLLLGHKRLLF